jgi:hypothetical protein
MKVWRKVSSKVEAEVMKDIKEFKKNSSFFQKAKVSGAMRQFVISQRL